MFVASDSGVSRSRNLQGAVVIDLRLDMDLGRFEALLNGASGLPGTRRGRYEKKVKMADAPGQRAGELVRQSMALGGQGALKIGGSVMGCLGVADQDQGLPEFLSRHAATLRHVLEPCDVNRRDAFQRHPVHPPKQYSIQDSPIPPIPRRRSHHRRRRVRPQRPMPRPPSTPSTVPVM